MHIFALAAFVGLLSGSDPQPPAATAPPRPLSNPRADAQVQALPVHIVDSASHPASQPPMVVVGSLFTGGHCFREDDAGTTHRTPDGQITLPVRLTPNRYSPVATEYLLGNVRPRPSCNDQETCAFVTSPPLNAVEEFRIDALGREGNTFILTASHWTDDTGQRWGPGPNHSAQIVRLGWLAPGDYRLIFVLKDRFSIAKGQRPALYGPAGVAQGETHFTVTNGDAWHFHSWDQPVSTAIIRRDDLNAPTFNPPPPDSGPHWQLPYFSHRRTSLPAGDTPATASVTLTPPLDWHKHSQQATTLWDPLAGKPNDPVPQATVVARVNGGSEHALGKFDWADVSAVVWEGDTVTIHANTWRRGYIFGNGKVRDAAEFAVPLETGHIDPDPVKAAARITVKVAWQNGLDNPRNAVEEVRH